MTNVLTAEDQIVEVLGSSEQITVYDVAEPQVVEVESQAELLVIEAGNDNQAVDVVSPIVAFMQVDVLETGPQGRPGMDSVDLFLVAAIAIGGQRVVATDDQGMAVYADNLKRYKTVIGISTGAAAQGAVVTVKPFGRLEDSSWNWNPGKGLFLDQNGIIVQDAPSAGAIVPLGFVVTPTRIFISIGSRIERE
jgi:hypothetical protein